MESHVDIEISQPGVRRRPLYGRSIIPPECDEERESLKKVKQRIAEIAAEKAERIQSVMGILRVDNKKAVTSFLELLRKAGVTEKTMQDDIIQSVAEIYPQPISPGDSPPSLIELVPAPESYSPAVQQQAVGMMQVTTAPPPPAFRPEDIVLPPPPQKKSGSIETDKHRLHQRYKQVLNGKNTQAYLKAMQITNSKSRPTTPNIYQLCSKRAWDGQLRQWRRLLHSIADAEAQREREQADTEVPLSMQMPVPIQLPEATTPFRPRQHSDSGLTAPRTPQYDPMYGSGNGSIAW